MAWRSRRNQADNLEITSNVIDFDGNYTWMVWCRPANVTNWQSYPSISNATGTLDDSVWFNTTGFILFVNDAAGTGNFAPTVNTWYHMCVVRDSTTSLTLYIDGVSSSTHTATVGGRALPTAFSWTNNRIWTDNVYTPESHWEGGKAWTRALSVAEILDEMTQHEPVHPLSLYGVWPMLEGNYIISTTGANNLVATAAGVAPTENLWVPMQAETGIITDPGAAAPIDPTFGEYGKRYQHVPAPNTLVRM